MKHRVWQICLISILCTGLVGCGSLTEPGGMLFNLKLVKIEDLKTQRKLNSKVYIQGTVENHAPFLGTTAYQMRDESGTIWVLTTKPAPPLTSEIRVEGKVLYQSIQVQGIPEDLGEFYLEEIQQIQPETAEEESQE